MKRPITDIIRRSVAQRRIEQMQNNLHFIEASLKSIESNKEFADRKGVYSRIFGPRKVITTESYEEYMGPKQTIFEVSKIYKIVQENDMFPVLTAGQILKIEENGILIYKMGDDRMSGYIFDNFSRELKESATTGKAPAHGDQDVRFGLELQKARLDAKNLIMKYDSTPRGHFAEGGGYGRSWSDARYTSRMEYRSCALKRTLYQNKKRVFERKQDSLFYQIITDVNDPAMAADEYYTCPNCGAVSRVKELENGCGYCGTHFEMSDLFPKVTNFYFIKDSGGTKEEIKRSVAKVVIPCILVASIGYILYFMFSPASEVKGVFAVISGILGGIVAGGILGYMIWAVSKIGSIFKEAAKSISMLVNSAGSGKRFVSFMQRYSPEFSYEYFSGKVVSSVKMIIFSEDARELPIYDGAPLGDLCKDIVETSYAGAVALKRLQVKDNWCHVIAEVYMEDIYEYDGRISAKNDLFRVELKKDLSRPVNLHFSIKKVQCKNCGGSFDATKMRCCPNCGTEYKITDEDWIVTRVQKF